MREAREDRERRVLVEHIIGVEIRDMRIGFRIGRNLKIDVDTENLTHRHFHVGGGGNCVQGVHEFLFRGEAAGPACRWPKQ